MAQKSGIIASLMGARSSTSSFGEPLSGVDLVEKVIEIVENYPGRDKDSRGLPGGLVVLPKGQRPIIIGDLHANVDNLRYILSHETNESDMASGKAFLLFVGDALHDDRTGNMRDMSGSMVILDEVLALIATYPGRVYYIRGNHDTFDERLRKSGVAQGEECRKALIASKGQEFTDAVARFFDALPVFVIGEGYVVTHAGPIRGGCTREELVEIWRRPDYAMQLMWNRVNEYHGTPSPKEYGNLDIRLMLENLDMPPETHFIVGHNPMWNDGGRTGVWRDIIGIRNHHILYSGSGSLAPYMTMENGTLTSKMSMPQEPEAYYYG